MIKISYNLLFCALGTTLLTINIISMAQPQDAKLSDLPGVVVLDEQLYHEQDTIVIYNKDRSVWHQLSFYFDLINDKREDEKVGFAPLAHEPDYFVLHLVCIGESEDHYEVFVDEAKTSKYIRKSDVYFKLMPWSALILNSPGIAPSDINTNPVRQSIQGAPYEYIHEEAVLKAVEIKGNWVRVQWNAGGVFSTEEKILEGWFEWTINDKLAIQFIHAI